MVDQNLYMCQYNQRTGKMGKSTPIFVLKENIKNRYVMVIRIHRPDGDERYTKKLKYSLVFIEPKNGKKVLMDNHHPKGPHYHLDENEYSYILNDVDALIEDFKKLVLQHFGEKI